MAWESLITGGLGALGGVIIAYFALRGKRIEISAQKEEHSSNAEAKLREQLMTERTKLIEEIAQLAKRVGAAETEISELKKAIIEKDKNIAEMEIMVGSLNFRNATLENEMIMLRRRMKGEHETDAN